MGPQLGRTLIILGVVLVLVGLALVYAGKIPYVGRLPGDVVWKKGNTRIYFPVVTMLILSALLTLVLYLVSRFLGRN
jgi:hypothetical protein